MVCEYNKNVSRRDPEVLPRQLEERWAAPLACEEGGGAREEAYLTAGRDQRGVKLNRLK